MDGAGLMPDKYRDLARIKGWRSAHPERVREYNRKSWDRVGYWTKARKAYGLEKSQIEQALQQQGGVCAICQQEESLVVRGRKRPLHIDHDHKTNKFRGLLCAHCNTGLGKFRDNPQFLMAAFAYIVPGDKRFYHLLRTIAVLHSKKQEDYGADEDPLANIRASARWGVAPWIGSMIRLSDKVHRLQQFAKKGRLANESAEDSMLDIAVYALLTLILYREASDATGQDQQDRRP